MGKMNESTYEALYVYGKKVFNNEMNAGEAAKVVNQSNPEVALSSAEHYINWYSRMRAGDFLSWNTNAELLKYYVTKVFEEETLADAAKAILAARKYAQYKNKTDLDNELVQLAKDKGIELLEVPNMVGSVKKENSGSSENKSADSDKGGEDNLSEEKKIINKVKSYIEYKGFSYNGELIENFYLSLKSKPFVILAGTSGTGKTRLVKLFAEAVGATSDNGRYKLVSVRPDWSDSSDLFGHVNLQGKFVQGAITDFIKDAMDNTDKPYFLCLDEMNLARVEYYLSDFLSIIETRKRDEDNGQIITDEIVLDEAARENYEGLYLPENLYVIGTVNMDETTFPFSKKVLDRANTIEFSYVNLEPDFGTDVENVESVEQDNDFLRTEYIILKTDTETSDQAFITKVCTELQAINETLQEANAHVGYRVRDEIVFYMLNNEKSKLLEYNDALDNEIMQKILPRIQGSGAATKDLLCELFKKFAGDYSGLSQEQTWKQMKTYIGANACKYKKSAEKICYMMRRFEEDGFTSYWL